MQAWCMMSMRGGEASHPLAYGALVMCKECVGGGCQGLLWEEDLMPQSLKFETVTLGPSSVDMQGTEEERSGCVIPVK